MDAERRDFLRQNIVRFKDDMIGIEDVMDNLVACRVLSLHSKNEIKARNLTDRERAGALHEFIQKRGPGAFDQYYLALKDTENNVLAKILEDHLVDKSLKIRSDRPASPHAQETGEPMQETIPSSTIASPADDLTPEVPEDWPLNNNIYVVNCDPSDEDMKRKLSDGDNVYGMKNKNTRILIINNKVFENSKDTNEKLGVREGTDMDATCLDLLFTRMGFRNIHKKKDLTGPAILDVLKDEARKCKPSDEGFICFILSHGIRGSVYGTDGKPVQLEVIYKQFDGIKCPALAGKPKLFFIQACQGTMKDDACAGGTDTEDTRSVEDQLSPITNQLEQLKIAQEATDATSMAREGPVKADMFVAVATTPDYVSWRDTKDGTWFIQALVYVLKNHAHKYELQKILQLVNRMVSKKTTRDGACKQVSHVAHSLTKDLYFFPGMPGLLGQEEPSSSQPCQQ